MLSNTWTGVNDHIKCKVLVWHQKSLVTVPVFISSIELLNKQTKNKQEQKQTNKQKNNSPIGTIRCLARLLALFIYFFLSVFLLLDFFFPIWHQGRECNNLNGNALDWSTKKNIVFCNTKNDKTFFPAKTSL